jgi:hypothetical protein
MNQSRIRWSEQIGQNGGLLSAIQQPSRNGHAVAHNAWRRRLLRTFFALVVLVPCMYGFCTKFWELVVICRGDMTGAFAIAPIVNYLLASAGFLLLLGWAAANGMFHDIERPKQTMLENERRLDQRR